MATVNKLLTDAELWSLKKGERFLQVCVRKTQKDLDALEPDWVIDENEMLKRIVDNCRNFSRRKEVLHDIRNGEPVTEDGKRCFRLSKSAIMAKNPATARAKLTKRLTRLNEQIVLGQHIGEYKLVKYDGLAKQILYVINPDSTYLGLYIPLRDKRIIRVTPVFKPPLTVDSTPTKTSYSANLNTHIPITQQLWTMRVRGDHPEVPEFTIDMTTDTVLVRRPGCEDANIMQQRLAELTQNGFQTIQEWGKLFSVCMLCGNDLTDLQSQLAGLGPSCLERMRNLH
jgi:hypothetical protein